MIIGMNIVIIFLTFILIVGIVSGLYFYKNIKIDLPIMGGALSDYEDKLSEAIKYFELIDYDEMCKSQLIDTILVVIKNGAPLEEVKDKE